MKIHLPNSAFIGNIDPFLRALDLSKPQSLEITTNKNWISIHPVVLSLIAALGLQANQEKIKCDSLEAKSIHYLERMGLFKFLGIESGIKITKHEPAGRFIPLTQINKSDELSHFIKDMIPLLHLEPKQAEPINYAVSELVRNVIEHANSKDGAIVCAQYYEKSNRIAIGIVDTGVGIKKTINQSYPAETSMKAIQLALTPGITGTTNKEGGTELNAGAGLFFIKTITKVNNDLFMVYTGNALYKLLKSTTSRLYSDPFRDRHSQTEDLPTFNGTMVGIDISLNETKEFSAILSLIRRVYAQSVKERKKARYRRPKFI